MREEFLNYYNRELAYLRQLGVSFANKYPNVASHLRLEDHSDPHVERLIEAFAFIAARIHLHIDDEFPEITEALLQILYPNFTRPVPSMAVVEFQLDPKQGQATTGKLIPKGTVVLSRPSQGFSCRFRTCYDCLLLPLAVENVFWIPPSRLPGQTSRRTAAAIEVRVSCNENVDFGSLELSNLRFYLNGAGELNHAIYELLLNRCHSILVQDLDSADAKILDLRPDALHPVGFGAGETLCPAHGRNFIGYQILEDYFAFPEKYFFLDVNGFDKMPQHGLYRRISIKFLLSPFERTDWVPLLEQGLSASVFRLGSTPVVNLFSYTSDPIPVRQTTYEVPITIDSRLEVFSVDDVYSQSADRGPSRTGIQELTSFAPFFGTHAAEKRGTPVSYWHVARRPSRLSEGATDYVLSLVDGKGALSNPNVDSLTAKLTCTNGILPSRLPMGDDDGDFQIEGIPEVYRILCLRRPTSGCQAQSSKHSLWRLVSQLSLNHLSLVNEGREALQWLLRLHNLSDADFGSEAIKGIVELRSKPHFARVSSEHGMAFVRGKLIELTLDEERFVGAGAYLFASVLERFLGLYTSLNSFAQLTLKTPQRGEKIFAIWPPRAGSKVVL